jgi:hypothetical protein
MMASLFLIVFASIVYLGDLAIATPMFNKERLLSGDHRNAASSSGVGATPLYASRLEQHCGKAIVGIVDPIIDFQAMHAAAASVDLAGSYDRHSPTLDYLEYDIVYPTFYVSPSSAAVSSSHQTNYDTDREIPNLSSLSEVQRYFRSRKRKCSADAEQHRTNLPSLHLNDVRLDELCGRVLNTKVMSSLVDIIQIRNGHTYDMILQQAKKTMTPRLANELLSRDEHQIQHAIHAIYATYHLRDQIRTWVEVMSPREVEEVLKNVVAAVDVKSTSEALDLLYKRNLRYATAVHLLLGDTSRCREIIFTLNRQRTDPARESEDPSKRVRYHDLQLWARGLNEDGKMLARKRFVAAAGRSNSWWTMLNQRGDLEEGFGLQILHANHVQLMELVSKYVEDRPSHA